MKAYPATERVVNLRNRAMESLTHCQMIWTDYGWNYRQKFLFYEGWEKSADAPTTLLRRAQADAYMIENLPVCIQPEDDILGMHDLIGLNEQEQERFDQMDRCMDQFGPRLQGRLDHMAPDYDKLIQVGIDGLLQEVRQCRQSLSNESVAEFVEKTEFYDMCELELTALLHLAERYASTARAMGMEEAAARLERVPKGPATSFHDALQSVHFYSFVLHGLYPFGHPDRSLIELYRKDIQRGVLTEERALELLDQFNLQYTFYTRPAASISYMIGGRMPDGTPVENELTWLLLQSIRHTAMPYPSVGLAVNEHTSNEILEYAVQCLADGYTHPALFNDNLITEALIQTGKPAEHARDYVHSSCVEITPCGRSGVWVTSPYHNCPQILLDMLKKRNDFADLNDMLAEYEKEINAAIVWGLKRENQWQLERRRNGGESILVSCLMEDCIARGKAIDQGGALYNDIMPNFVGVSNVIDSLAAIDMLVFKEKRITLPEYMEMVNHDFENAEELRQYVVRRCPHFGNNDEMTNDLAIRLYQMIEHACEGLTTFRGAKVLPGAFSFMMHEEYGCATQATPDGRKAGEAFNAGADPVSGRDVHGPTASILSMTQWNALPFLGGVANNINLCMQNATQETIRNVCALVKVFMQRGGVELQVNCVTAEVLEDAIAHPEAHGDLIVRIGGYSDFFVNQSEAMQREILHRTQHGMSF